MFLSYFIDSAEYLRDPFWLEDYHKGLSDLYAYYGPNDLSCVQRDIASYHTNKYIPLDKKDERFTFTLSKIEGCAAFSIQAFFLRPSTTFYEKWVGKLCIFMLPAGHLIDFQINSVILFIQTALVLDAIVVGVLKKSASYFLPKNVLSEKDKRWFDLDHTHFARAFINVTKSMFLAHVEGMLAPLYYFGIINPILGLKHTYWVYDRCQKKFHLVLDQDKVQWLQNKYGYTLDKERLLRICVPSNPVYLNMHPNMPGQLKLSYDAREFQTPQDIRIKATWVGWKQELYMGDDKDYDKVYHSYVTHQNPAL